MKIRIGLKVTGYILIIILGIIHLLNREELYAVYSGFQGLVLNTAFFAAIGFIFLANPSRPIRNKKGITLLCIGIVLYVSGMIFVETRGLGPISLSLIFIGAMMVISSDFLMKDFKSKNMKN